MLCRSRPVISLDVISYTVDPLGGIYVLGPSVHGNVGVAWSVLVMPMTSSLCDVLAGCSPGVLANGATTQGDVKVHVCKAWSQVVPDAQGMW